MKIPNKATGGIPPVGGGGYTTLHTPCLLELNPKPVIHKLGMHDLSETNDLVHIVCLLNPCFALVKVTSFAF